MSGLVLKLAPGERLLLNGAVLENGPKRAQIRIRSRDANVLRMRDAQHPQEAVTPVRRACLVAQMALSGDLPPEEAREGLAAQIDLLVPCFAAHRDLLVRSRKAVDEMAFYPALRLLRGLIPVEARMLAASG